MLPPPAKLALRTSVFMLFEDCKNFQSKSGQNQNRGYCYPGKTVHLFWVKNIWIFTFPAGHQEQPQSHNYNSDDHPTIIFLTK